MSALKSVCIALLASILRDIATSKLCNALPPTLLSSPGMNRIALHTLLHSTLSESNA